MITQLDILSVVSGYLHSAKLNVDNLQKSTILFLAVSMYNYCTVQNSDGVNSISEFSKQISFANILPSQIPDSPK